MPPRPRTTALTASLLVCAVTAACATDPETTRIDASVPVTTPVRPWTSLAPDDSRQDFDFLVVTDRTGGHRPGVFASAMPKVNLLRPAFVMSVGDLIEGYTEDRGVVEDEWNEFEGFIRKLRMPFFYVPGNHDLSNETMARIWRERFGASYYHFVYKDVLFVALNSELFSMVSNPGTSLPGPDAQADQMAWLEGVLENHPDVRWTLVFVHQPLWDSPRIHPDWSQIEQWLGDRPHTVFAGHIHQYTHHSRQGRDYITLATTGGGSGMRGLLHGEFDHVALVSMRKDGPVIANLLLDGIHGARIRDAELRSVVQQLERAVRAEPVRFEGMLFSEGTLDFKVHNDGDVPLQLEGTVHPSRNLSAVEPAVQITVEPNTVADLRIPVAALAPTRFEDLAAAGASWRLRTHAPDGRPVELELESSLIPERLFDCPEPQRPVEVDGSLAEWDTLAMTADPPAVTEQADKVRDAADASFRFDVRCDPTHLYLGVSVRDESIVASPDRIGREQDRVNVMIDARADPARSASGKDFFAAIGDGTFRKLAIFSAGPEPTPAVDSVFAIFLPPRPEGIENVSQITEHGYDVEFAVPLSVLDALHGEHFDAFRLELSVYDFDEDEPGHATLWWRPSRFSAQAIAGSGTFARP